MSAPAAKVDDGADRRAYFRVEGTLRFRRKSASEEEVEQVRHEIQARPREYGTSNDEQLLLRLARMEEKLDWVLSLLDPSTPPPLGDADLKELQISASGVRFPSQERFDAETPLLVEFTLPEVPPREVRCIGRVVRSWPAEGEHDYQVAVHFTELCESDRDAIVRYALMQQRASSAAERDAEESAEEPGGSEP